MDAMALSGATLDCWVALAEGHGNAVIVRTGRHHVCHLAVDGVPVSPFSPGTDWDAAWPIIQRERILLRERRLNREPVFEAMLVRDGITWFAIGELPLVAAMRVLVRSRIPEQMLDGARFGQQDAA
ncbi:phage protein NinX family protein [Variovorax sp. VNK109]|uniref:phage protein NinX family protein n=1 Tax=Variovorax sp. VNK109 TaxID=3400919 RepID=UPI003C05CE58